MAPHQCHEGLVPGLYDEPVSEHLHNEVVALGPAALLHAARTDETGIPGLEAWLGEAVGLALQSVAKRKDHAAAMPALVHDLMEVLQLHAPGAFSRPAELTLTDQWLQAVTEGAAKPPGRPKGSLHAPSLLVPPTFSSMPRVSTCSTTCAPSSTVPTGSTCCARSSS